MTKPTTKPAAKKGKRKQVDDAQFLELYFRFGEVQTEVAKYLGVTSAAVWKRLKKIGTDKIEASRRAGTVAVLIEEAKQEAAAAEEKRQQPVQVSVSPAFRQGVSDGIDRFQIFSRLEEYCATIDGTFRRLKQDIDEHLAREGAKVKGVAFQVDLLMKLIDRGTKQVEVIHKIRKDLLDIKGTMMFFEAVARLMEEETPDVRQRLHIKLLQLGAGGQAELISPEEIPGT